MPGKVTYSYNDKGGERSTVSLHIASLSGATYDGVVGAAGDVDQLRDAIAALTLGELDGVKVLGRDSDAGAAKASSPSAMRELKWLCTYSDDVSLIEYQFEMPCPDITIAGLCDTTEQKNALLAHASWATFITEFETLARSPTGGAVTFIAARQVGRNL
jgi:hypothetical protein